MWWDLRVGLVVVVLLVTTRTNAFVTWSISSQQLLLRSNPDLRINGSSRRWTTRRHNGNKKSLLGASKRATGSAKQRAVPRYVRLEQRTTPRTRRTVVELQTAVQRFVKTCETTGDRVTVDLHAQLHFGTERYFDYYNSNHYKDNTNNYAMTNFANQYDRVHYELVCDQTLLHTTNNVRRLVTGTQLMASPHDAATASRYGLVCQMNVVNYDQPSFVHADLSRQELLAELHMDETSNNNQQPIWALASTGALRFPGVETAMALWRPTAPSLGSSSSSGVERRLFSNLFWAGGGLAAVMRALLWMAVPSPELSVLLLDWSSVMPRPTGGISPLALPVLECLLTGNLREAQQLVFSQLIQSGQNVHAHAPDDTDVIVKKRNQKALQVLDQSLAEDGYSKHAILYGAMHCSDLHRQLQNRGFVSSGTLDWRTAWSVEVPSFGTGVSLSGGRKGTPESFAASSSPSALAVGLVVVPAYLLVGGLDWIDTLQSIGTTALDQHDWAETSLVLVLYMIRHAALYLSLSKFVVEWDGANLFGTK